MRRSRFGLIALIASLALGGCEDCNTAPPVGEDASIRQVDCLIDPLYDHSSAQEIAVGETVEGTICPQGFDDRDYYRITTGPGDGILEIHLWNDTGFTSVDLRAALLEGDGTPTPLAFSNSNGTGAVTDIRGAFGVAASTPYIIEISDEGGDDGDTSNLYFMEVTLSPQPDSHESNDRLEDATAAACDGQPLTGYLATRGDVDFFQCQSSSQPARLKLSFSAGAELGWQPHLLITNDQGQALLDQELVALADGSYAYEGAVAITRYEANSTNPELSETRAHTGAVNVRVQDIDGTLFNFDAASGAYQLSLSVDTGPGSDPEPAERNDAPGSATLISAGQTASGFLASFGDIDWYRIDAGASGVLEIVLDMPADGVVPEGVDPNRVGVNLEVYDARLSISSAGAVSTTTGCTESPTYATALRSCDNFNASADNCSTAHGDQQPVCMPGSFCGELRHSHLLLQGAIEQRVPLAASYKTAVALRANHPVFVALSHFQGQVFQDGQPYSLRFNVASERDSHEPNDLPPALNREARYSSSASAVRSCSASHFPITPIGGYSGDPACDPPSWTCPVVDGGTADVCDWSNTSGGSCLPWVNNSSVDGGMVDDTPYTSLDCSGAGTGTYTTTGYLSFVGDRDYYSFNLPPGDIEVNIDLQGTGASTTGLEAGIFVFTAGQRLYASFVDAQRANTVSARTCTDWRDCCDNAFECEPDEVPCEGGMCAPPRNCGSHTECPEDYLCIRDRCFSDNDSHPVPDRTFGPEGGNCLVAPTCGEANPWIIEITDNGQNDYDLDMQYTLTVRWRCNCPDLCGYCRAPLYYRNCTDSVR